MVRHPLTCVWRETLKKIKSKTDVIVCCTTGGGVGMTPEQRIAVVPEFKPEMCSFNVESMNFGFPSGGENQRLEIRVGKARN
ncbi:MAG: 3-keto-5-aminohexanoate cleavage protein [Candidatus Lokiarchaeia archaeon]